MYALCRQWPCDSRCPNAPEPTPVLICTECGRGIYQHDRYLQTGKGPICEERLEEYGINELLGLVGSGLTEVEGDD